MTKLAKQSCILAAILFLICVAGRIFTGSTYTAYVPIPYMYQESGAFRIEHTGEGGSMTFEEPQPGLDCIKIQTRPEKPGKVEATLRNDQGEDVS